MSSSQDDRRRSRRLPVKLTAHCRIGHRFVREPVGDLSGGGLYLRTREPARLGLPVRVALVLPGRDGPEFCTLTGAVARVDQEPGGRMIGVAVRFEPTQIGDADRELLDAYLEKTAEASP